MRQKIVLFKYFKASKWIILMGNKLEKML